MCKRWSAELYWTVKGELGKMKLEAAAFLSIFK